MVYTAGSASLALLEILVHVESTLLPHYVGIPVRFDSDRIATSVASFQAGEVPNVPVVEVRV